jgi:group I intron endonuclease
MINNILGTKNTYKNMKNTIIAFNKSLPCQPAIVYSNAETDKLQILSDNKKRSGIYLWTHKESGKMYVGSAVDLSLRLKDYYSPLNLKRRDNYISRALILHTHSAFSLTILEFISIENLSLEETHQLIFSKEQYFFDLLSSEYNIQKIAGSSLGQKRSENTKTLISKIKSGLTKSIKTKLKISEALKGKTHSEETKAKMSVAKGTTIFVYDSEGSLISTFSSIREAGKYFNCSYTTINKYAISEELFQDKWILSSFKK